MMDAATVGELRVAKRLDCWSYGLTHVGTVRSVNEDAWCLSDRTGLWAVCDGLGGLGSGDIASRLVADRLSAVTRKDTAPELLRCVVTELETANSDLLSLADDRDLGRIGTTVACLLRHGDQGLAVWAGDSRIYRLRRGLQQRVTRDHSMVQELLDAGEVGEDELQVHPQSHVVTRAIGVENDIVPSFMPVSIEPADRFLLCSDGLTNALEDSQIQNIIEDCDNPRGGTEALITLALEHGARDNVTAVLIWMN